MQSLLSKPIVHVVTNTGSTITTCLVKSLLGCDCKPAAYSESTNLISPAKSQIKDNVMCVAH